MGVRDLQARQRRPLLALLLCAAFVSSACNAGPTPSSATPTPTPPDITVIDSRLLAPVRAIAENPEWAPGSTDHLNAHLALSSGDDLCVEVLRPDLLPLYVTLDTESQSWTVKSIVVFDQDTDRSPRVTYDNGDPDGDPDTCRLVLGGSGEPFPFDPGSIEIVGGVDPAHATEIARAVVSFPQAFGIDRSSEPSLNVRPLGSADANRVCYDATVFQGGPRSTVRITLRRDAEGGEWRFYHVRVIDDSPSFVPEGAC